ncbi:MAG: recombination mediator RecR [Solitalea-like symbiont of Tyrophagus putrescentiae]
MLNITSQLLKDVIYQLSKLPGLGYRSSLRLAVYILNNNDSDVDNLIKAITKLKNDIHICEICGNIADETICNICKSNKRDAHVICMVEDILGIIAIENTNEYFGLYHVLNGVIAPVDGVGPDKLNIQSLYNRINPEVKEIIFALNSTPEGDTTTFYISKKILEINPNIKISVLSQGISPDSEIEYTNSVTLAKSIENRIEYKNTKFSTYGR